MIDGSNVHKFGSRYRWNQASRTEEGTGGILSNFVKFQFICLVGIQSTHFEYFFKIQKTKFEIFHSFQGLSWLMNPPESKRKLAKDSISVAQTIISTKNDYFMSEKHGEKCFLCFPRCSPNSLKIIEMWIIIHWKLGKKLTETYKKMNKVDQTS